MERIDPQEPRKTWLKNRLIRPGAFSVRMSSEEAHRCCRWRGRTNIPNHIPFIIATWCEHICSQKFKVMIDKTKDVRIGHILRQASPQRHYKNQQWTKYNVANDATQHRRGNEQHVIAAGRMPSFAHTSANIQLLSVSKLNATISFTEVSKSCEPNICWWVFCTWISIDKDMDRLN